MKWGRSPRILASITNAKAVPTDVALKERSPMIGSGRVFVLDSHAIFPTFPSQLTTKNKNGFRGSIKKTLRRASGGELGCRLQFWQFSRLDLFSLSLFVVVICFSFLFFAPPCFSFPKRHESSPGPPHPRLYGSAFYIYASEQEHVSGCHTVHKLKPKFGTFGTCSSIPSPGRGRSARQPVFIAPPSPRGRWGGDYLESTLLVSARQSSDFTQSLSCPWPGEAERHEAARVYPGSLDSCCTFCTQILVGLGLARENADWIEAPFRSSWKRKNLPALLTWLKKKCQHKSSAMTNVSAACTRSRQFWRSALIGQRTSNVRWCTA